MAELSAETTAIVERLRAEGDLVRNSGTNSIRSVKIKLDRFDGLFTSIQTNVAEQTQILRQQAGIQEAAAENRKRQEDFDNLKAGQEVVEKKNDRAAQEERDAKMIDAMRSAFSLKNLALGAGGAFLGYNLLKGAIDKQFNGAFSNMEKGISEFNPAVIQETFTNLKTTIRNMDTTIANLNTTVAGLQSDIEKFKENITSFGFWVGSLTSIIGAAFALNAARKLAEALDKINDKRIARRTPNINPMLDEQGRGSRYANYGEALDRAGEAERARLAEAERVKAIADAKKIETERFRRAKRISDMEIRTIKPTFTPNGSNYTPPDRMSVAGFQTAANVNTSPIKTVTGFSNTPQTLGSNGGPGTFRVTPGMTAVPANNNKPATKSDLQRLLQEYNDRIPAKWRKALIKIFDFLARANVVFKVADLIFILYALEQTDENQRTAMLGQWLGSTFGAALGGFAGAWAGVAGGPFAWLTIPVGGIGGAIIGSYGGEWIGVKIVEWALDETPQQGEIDKVQRQINDALGTSQLMEEAAAKYGGGAVPTTTSANYGPPGTGGLGLFDVPAAAISGMGVGSGRVYPNARLSSAQARRIVNVAPGFETNALDAIADLALQNGNTVIIKGGDQTVSPVITQKGGDAFVEAPTIIGSHIDKNMNTYASGPYPGTVYD
jgi:hypothetical protein